MRTTVRGLGAALLVGGLSLSVVPGASAAPAEASGTVAFACSMPDFGASADFAYNATVKISGKRATENGPVTLSMSASDLPGVVPPFISMKDQDVSISFVGKANGTPVTLTATGLTDVNPTKDNKTKDPVKLPAPIKGKADVTAADVTVSLSTFKFDVAGVGGTCTAASSDLPAFTPEIGAVEETPTVSPTPTKKPTATASPTAKPTKKPTKKPSSKPTEKAADAGKPVSGQIAFDCVLSPFDSAFRYEGKATVSGVRAKEGDSKVTLAASLPQIPGIAPVPIENGRMVATVKATVDGKPVSLSSETTVNAAAKAKVSVKRATGQVTTTAEKAKVDVQSFAFKFDPISGLEISAECEIAKGGSMGAMAIGVGELAADDDDSDGSGGSGSGTGGTTAGTEASLPRTGGGDAMPVITLWAMALGVLGAGLLVWIPVRRATSQS